MGNNAFVVTSVRLLGRDKSPVQAINSNPLLQRQLLYRCLGLEKQVGNKVSMRTMCVPWRHPLFECLYANQSSALTSQQKHCFLWERQHRQRWISNTKWSRPFSIREFGKIITVSKAGYLPTGTPNPDLKEGAIAVGGFWVISPLAVNIENSNKNRNNTEKCEGERSEAELFFEKLHKIERFPVTLEHKLRWKSKESVKAKTNEASPSEI